MNKNTNTNTKRHTVNLEEDTNIRVSRFHPLQYPTEEVHNNNNSDDDAEWMRNVHFAMPNRKKADQIKQSPKRPPIIVKENPENEGYFTKTVPGNSTYSDITKEGKNTCIIGDSIVKGINMREFNKYVEHSTAIKRNFPGARTKQLMYYIEDILNEENLHRIIINVGTNNLSDQNQTENEIMMEIIEIAKKCHQYGINEIFIAGLTIRPRYDKQINIINNLLKENATKFNYRFIDNTDIMEKHL